LINTLRHLGLKSKQRFYIRGCGRNKFFFNCDDSGRAVLIRDIGGGGYRFADLNLLMSIYDDPTKIIRIIDLTDGQRELLCAYERLGMNWLAKDMSGTIKLFAHKPTKDLTTWRTDSQAILLSPPDGMLKDLVSWTDIEPMNIAQALGKNNDETETEP
jgi:hypothetical protein